MLGPNILTTMPTSRFLTSSMRFLLNQARVRQGFSIEARDSRGVSPKAFGPLAPAGGMRYALDPLPSREGLIVKWMGIAPKPNSARNTCYTITHPDRTRSLMGKIQQDAGDPDCGHILNNIN